MWQNEGAWNNSKTWDNTENYDVPTLTDETLEVTPAIVTDINDMIEKLNRISVLGYNTITVEQELVDGITAGYMIDRIIFEETSGNTGQISAGIRADEFELFTQQEIQGSDLTVISIDKIFSMTDVKSIYLHTNGAGDTWNNMELNVYVLLLRII
jgi:hypothetical protein